MTFEEAFENYCSAKKKLEEVVGFPLYYDMTLIDCQKWSYNAEGVEWEDDGLYAEDASLLNDTFENHTIFRVHGCTGDRYYAVYNKSAMVDQID